MQRREFLRFCAGGSAGAVLSLTGISIATTAAAEPLRLRIQKARYTINGAVTQDMVSLSQDQPPPVLRMKQHEPFVVHVTNDLEDYTAMHWHGIRVPNKMDGVPYLTQWPIARKETWRYAFTPEDAGTYWYHPHCMTMEQMARGLTGVLIVEERESVGFDTETIVNLRDFRLGEDSQFIKFFSPRMSARSGTLGTIMTANWKQNPVYEHQTGALVRLRLVATDVTRIYKLFATGEHGKVIAIDGHPVRDTVAWPTDVAPHIMGPGQRIELAIKMPDREGAEVVITHQSGQAPRPLVTLRSVGAPLKRNLKDLHTLPANPVPEPDLKSAEVVEFVFGWTPQSMKPNNGYCGSLGYTFWSIDRKPWPGDAADGTKPLAELKLGRSYILRLRNESPNAHPIHLHGLTFRPIRSNQRNLPSNWTDTALLQKNETIDIALVASNPGDWAFHCHVIEHQKTGLAGFIRVS